MKYAVKIIAAMITAAVMVASAAVCVSAEEYMSDFNYIAQDSFGIIYLSNQPLRFFPVSSVKGSNSCIYMCIQPENTSNTYNQHMIILYPENIGGQITYTIKYINYQSLVNKLMYDLTTGTLDTSISVNSSGSLYLYGSSSIYANSISSVSIKYHTSAIQYENSTAIYKITANYSPILHKNNYPSSYRIPDSNITIDESLSLHDLISSTDKSSSIIQAITTIQNVINNNYEQIMNSGSGNPLPSGGSDLGQAQNNLSSAEDALSNKSDSLASSVSNQWTTYKSTTQTFVTDIKPSATAVSTIYTNFVDSLPDEIKALLISIPILIFLGWLIGRVRG